MKRLLIGLLLYVTGVFLFGDCQSSLGPKDYHFFLLLPAEDNQVGLAIYLLDELKVCRFPNGPVRVNSLKDKYIQLISIEDGLQFSKCAQKLLMLCLDRQQQPALVSADTGPHQLCGFALPWEQGMAYVFDDLPNISVVQGFIVSKEEARKQNLMIEGDRVCRSESMNDFEMDEIDLLISEQPDRDYVSKPLPYPLQKAKNFFGKIVISCLIRYHRLRVRMYNWWRQIHAQSKS